MPNEPKPAMNEVSLDAHTRMKTVNTKDAAELTSVRGTVYGPPIIQFKVAQQIKGILNQAFKDNQHQTPLGVSGEEYDLIREAVDMIAVKLARIGTGDPTYLDNWDDIAGYCRCVTDYFRSKN